MRPSQALQGGGCVSDFLHSQTPESLPEHIVSGPWHPPTLPTTHCLRLAPWRRTHPSTWHSIQISSLLRKRDSLNKHICDIIIIVPFCPELSFTCRVDLLSANIPNISMQRGFWDKVSRVEEIKIIYQSQPLEGHKYTCTMGHSFCGKTEVLQIFKRDLFNTLPPGKWPHGPIHSACGTEGAPSHWGDTPTTMTIMLKLAKNMLMNRC